MNTLDVMTAIEDPMKWLEDNRKQGEAAKERLKPIEDVVYGLDPMQKLDIYVPKYSKKAPVLIDVHGGGWSAGSKNPRSAVAEPLLEKGIMVAAIDYGLAPKYSLGQIIDHVHQAVTWVHQNIERYGGDPNQLFISGNSAGAHLAATTLKHFSPILKGAFLSSGIFNMEEIARGKGGSLIALRLSQEEAYHFSPLYDLPKHPLPVVIAYGENESIAYMNESTTYAAALKKAGCNVTLIATPHAHHFDMINEIGNTEGELFKVAVDLIFDEY